MVRVGLIGITGYARVHLDCLQKAAAAGRVELSCATVINANDIPDRVAQLEEAGTRVYPDYREMLEAEAQRLDLVCIPTAIDWHREMTIDALDAGANVLVEKPAAPLTAQVDDMIEAARRNGRFVEVGFQDMFDPANQWLKAQLLQGLIGDLQEIRCMGLWPRDQSYYRRNNWAGRMKSGHGWVLDSPVSNAFAHFVNLSLFFAGTAQVASARIDELEAELYRAQEIENFDTASLCIRTPESVRILINLTHSASQAEYHAPRIQMRGTKGEVFWDQNSEAVVRFLDGRPDRRCQLLRDPQLRPQMFDHILSRVEDESVGPLCPLELARTHTELVERLHQNFEIQPVRPDLLTSESHGDQGLLISIRDIGKRIAAAHESGSLLTGLGHTSEVTA